MFGPVDTSKPHTVVTVRKPCVIMPLRRAPLPAGEYAIQGDVRDKFRATRERRLMAVGVFSIKFQEGETVSAQTEFQQAVPVEEAKVVEPEAPSPETPDLVKPPVETVLEPNEKPVEFTPAEESTVGVEEKPEPEIKKIRGNSKIKTVAKHLEKGLVCKCGDVDFELISVTDKPDEPMIDAVSFTIEGMTYVKAFSEFKGLDATIAAFIEANEPENRDDSLEATPEPDADDAEADGGDAEADVPVAGADNGLPVEESGVGDSEDLGSGSVPPPAGADDDDQGDVDGEDGGFTPSTPRF